MQFAVLALLVAAFTSLFTLAGGALALRSRDQMHLVLGLAGGLLLGLVAFDLLPEVFGAAPTLLVSTAFVVGFLALHIVERAFGQHEPVDSEYAEHHHHSHSPAGWVGAIALAIHVLLDGMAIGITFQVAPSLGIAVAIAVIAHAFSDGLNTVAMIGVSEAGRKSVWKLLTLDLLARVSGALLGVLWTPSANFVTLYLAAFAGALIYLATSHILPEAHSTHPSRVTLLATCSGVVTMAVIVELLSSANF